MDIVEALKDLNVSDYDISGPWLWYVVYFYLSLPVLAYIVLPFLFSQPTSRTKSIAIFVLGDLGHSPRMCYHARSFADLEYNVNLCGYLESEIADDLMEHESIDIVELPVIRNTGNWPFIIFAIRKIILQVIGIFRLLFSFRYTDYILIQNPPCIPILFIVIVFVKLFSRNTRIIIDWHNLNYSILSLRYNNDRHFMVRALKMYEGVLSKFADLHFTVTKSMKKYLVKAFGVDKTTISVVYDRPGDAFVPLPKLPLTKLEILAHHIFDDVDTLKNYKILITATSFTPDEDFDVLLDALKLYDQSTTTQPLLLLVTGKGPLKQEFLRKVRQHQYLENIVVKSVWLLIEDYPLIMAIADIGVSLHTSSSGLDLPMKILDFFGCGIPVVSLAFASIGELIEDGENGLITNHNEKPSTELYRLINLLLTDDVVYSKIKAGAMRQSQLRWKQNWNKALANTFKYK